MNNMYKVRFMCKDCNQDVVSTLTIKANDEKQYKSEIGKELEMYHPFCCLHCGSDDFAVIGFREIQKNL